GAGAGFAVAAQLGAALHGFLLRVAEVIEAQAEGAAAVLQAHQQAASATHDDIGAGHDAFDHRILAWTQRTDRYHAGAILVAQRQVEEDVLQGFQADLRKLFGQRCTDALERRDRNYSQLPHLFSLSQPGVCPPNTDGWSRPGPRWPWAAGSWRARRWPRCGPALAESARGWRARRRNSDGSLLPTAAGSTRRGPRRPYGGWFPATRIRPWCGSVPRPCAWSGRLPAPDHGSNGLHRAAAGFCH